MTTTQRPVRPLRQGARWARHAGAALALGALLEPVTALAQGKYDGNVQNFRPAMDSRSFITVERSKVLGTLEPSIGLYLDYAFDPLTQRIDGEAYDLVTSMGSANFVLALGFANIVEVGVDVPVHVVLGNPDGPGDEVNLDGEGLGDVSFSMKLRILDRERFPVGIALVPTIGLGNGEPNIFTSHDQTPTFAGRAVLDMDLGERVGLALNVGARLRETREIAGDVTITAADGTARTATREDPYVFGNELIYALGLGVALVPTRLDLIIEAFGASPLASGAERATPLETLVALRIFLVGNSFFSLGASRGWLDSYGDPEVRGFAGIVFEPAVGDRDKDGINDDIDQCPDQPEDTDGFEDLDGCPDPDNDQDGIPDIVDQCPDVAEDRNGFEDEDGCPDGGRDRDGDGIPDVTDRCPDDPEDKDNYMDGDGCPEPDNDGDGLLDKVDRCPNDPEDLDGFEDTDGCPDPDNDQDGIPDVRDACPNEPESMNGIEDEDGCPEVPKKVIIEGGKLQIMDKVYFETAKAIIKPESYDILYQVAQTLKLNPQIRKVEVQGHTDSRSTDEYNLDLSNRRAAAVRLFLIERGGVETGRLVSKGYGESMPVDPAENIQAWEKNRRVEFIIMEESAPDRFDSPVMP